MFAQLIGTSPAGVEWVAYSPEAVERMTARLAQVWEKWWAKRVRIKLTSDSMAEAVEDSIQCALDSGVTGAEVDADIGRTVAHMSRAAAQRAADDMLYRAEDIELGGATDHGFTRSEAQWDHLDNMMIKARKRWAQRLTRGFAATSKRGR